MILSQLNNVFVYDTLTISCALDFPEIGGNPPLFPDGNRATGVLGTARPARASGSLGIQPGPLLAQPAACHEGLEIQEFRASREREPWTQEPSRAQVATGAAALCSR